VDVGRAWVTFFHNVPVEHRLLFNRELCGTTKEEKKQCWKRDLRRNKMNIKKDSRDFWDERYSQKDFFYGEEPNEYLKEKLKGLTPGEALFAAEGEGRNAVFAAKSGWKVLAFDQSEMGKTKAEVLAEKNGVQIDYIVSEVETINYPESSCDLLVLVFAHFHANKRKAYHQKLSAYLKEDGVLILEAFTKGQLHNQKQNPKAGGPKDVNMLYDLEGIKSDFEGFEFVEAIQTVTELNEGDFHTGKADVVRVVAIKK